MQNKRANTLMYKKISKWLDKYHSTSDAAEKTKMKTLIATQMMPIIKRIARTIARRSTDPIEDLVQAGFVGLLKAIDYFSKDKNDNFRVYAGYLIIGEMKHFLRDKLNAIRVPRHVQELAIRINNFINSLTMDELQTLTAYDVAFALNIPSKAVDMVMQADRRKSILSLDDLHLGTGENSLSFEEFISKGDYKQDAEYNDLRITFNSVIDDLEPEYRVLMEMYYKQDMNQNEIAEALVLTKMTMSRKMKITFEKFADLVVKRHHEIKESSILEDSDLDD